MNNYKIKTTRFSIFPFYKRKENLRDKRPLFLVESGKLQLGVAFFKNYREVLFLEVLNVFCEVSGDGPLQGVKLLGDTYGKR